MSWDDAGEESQDYQHDAGGDEQHGGHYVAQFFAQCFTPCGWTGGDYAARADAQKEGQEHNTDDHAGQSAFRINTRDEGGHLQRYYAECVATCQWVGATRESESASSHDAHAHNESEHGGSGDVRVEQLT